MLPTVTYIGGPAEMAYLAQSEAIYRVLLGRMPVAVPRAGFTMLDARSAKLMDRYRLTLSDFFHGETSLQERIASRLVPPALAGEVRETAATVEGAVARMRAELRGVRSHAGQGAGPQRRERSTTRSRRWSARPAAKPCAATNTPRAMRLRSTA